MIQLESFKLCVILINMNDAYIKPNWPTSKNVRAFVTTKACGNLADYVGDDLEKVLANRKKLCQELNLPSEPIWLTQVHGNNVICADNVDYRPEADAAFTTLPNIVCVVLTADCLPVLLCDRKGTKVAAIHCGWRSLSAGIIEKTIQKMQTSELLAWLGPAIGPKVYEVGKEVYEKFSPDAFKKIGKEKWLADIYALAKQQLLACGVRNIYGGGFCTYTDSKRFFSYRREGNTGRMASLIYLKLS
jgi:YfiH family protein